MRLRPSERVLQTVMAPEQFLADYETGRAEDTERHSALGLRFQMVLDLGRCRFIQGRVGLNAEAVLDRNENIGATDVAIIGKVGAIDCLNKRRSPAFRHAHQRQPRRR